MEKLRKVNNFNELKVGQIVIVMECRLCGRAKCRNMLIKLEEGFVKDKNDDIRIDTFWSVAPRCNNNPRMAMALDAVPVNDGRVWLVEDNLEKDVEINKNILEPVSR